MTTKTKAGDVESRVAAAIPHDGEADDESAEAEGGEEEHRWGDLHLNKNNVGITQNARERISTKTLVLFTVITSISH